MREGADEGSMIADERPISGSTSVVQVMTPAPIYEVRSLSLSYRTDHRAGLLWALKGVSFDVQPGAFVGIVGPNGSGKTSLLKLLGKVLHSKSGTIRLRGRDLATIPQVEVARTVAMVPQEQHQVFPFTVLETVLMGRHPHHGSTWRAGFSWENQEDLDIAIEAMEATDVAHLHDRAVTDLSGGERQRCLIARALAQTPQVLLLDEPTAFLDLPHQIEISALLRRLADRKGLTLLLISHDLNIAGQYADRMLMLKEGTLFAAGTPEEVIRPDILKAVYGCEVLVDGHPESGRPRVTLPVGRGSRTG
ncbi:MAG: ABC transporter ATP-binding protein [Nitrospiraceae bacterium]